MDLFFGTGRASAMKEGRAEAERREGEESNFTDISFTIESAEDSTQTCADCGGTEFLEDDLGRLTCKLCGLLNEQQLTQSQVVDEVNTKNIGRDRSGHAIQSKSVSGLIAESDRFQPMPMLDVRSCMDAIQWVLEKQARDLVTLFGCSTAVSRHIRRLWFAFVDCILKESKHPVGATNPNQRLLSFFINYNREGLSMRRSFLWLRLGLRTTAYLCYLACRELSEPVLLSDITRACAHGDMTYIAAYHQLPIALRWRVSRVRNFFLPGSWGGSKLFPSITSAWGQCEMIASKICGSSLERLPMPNWGICLLRLADAASMCADEKACTLRIWRLWFEGERCTWRTPAQIHVLRCARERILDPTTEASETRLSRGKKRCPNCAAIIPSKVSVCSSCGSKVTYRTKHGVVRRAGRLALTRYVAPPEIRIVAVIVIVLKAAGGREWYRKWRSRLLSEQRKSPNLDYVELCRTRFLRAVPNAQHDQILAAASNAIERQFPRDATKDRADRSRKALLEKVSDDWSRRLDSQRISSDVVQMQDLLMRLFNSRQSGRAAEMNDFDESTGDEDAADVSCTVDPAEKVGPDDGYVSYQPPMLTFQQKRALAKGNVSFVRESFYPFSKNYVELLQYFGAIIDARVEELSMEVQRLERGIWPSSKRLHQRRRKASAADNTENVEAV